MFLFSGFPSNRDEGGITRGRVLFFVNELLRTDVSVSHRHSHTVTDLCDQRLVDLVCGAQVQIRLMARTMLWAMASE